MVLAVVAVAPGAHHGSARAAADEADRARAGRRSAWTVMMRPPRVGAGTRSARAGSLGMMRAAVTMRPAPAPRRRRGVGHLVSEFSSRTLSTATMIPPDPEAMRPWSATTMRAACSASPRSRRHAHHRQASAPRSAPTRRASRPRAGGAREPCGRGRPRLRRGVHPTKFPADDPARPGRQRVRRRWRLRVERRDSQAGARGASPYRAVRSPMGG